MSDWWKKSVVYQIYPRSFKDSNGDGIGDLNGITEKLPYLADLGIDVIWLSPIYKSPNADNGYDISDFCAIMDEFGTMEDFDRMLERAHGLGLKTVMDLVVNHTSVEHPWFVESAKSKDNKYSDYYIWRDQDKINNWGSAFGGSAWQFHEGRGQCYLHSFHVKQADLNWQNPAVRSDIYKMMTWWCDKGIDGFRMDVINHISKDDFSDGVVDESGYSPIGENVVNGPHVHEYLKEMNREVLSKYDLLTVGETPDVTPADAIQYAGFDSNELNMVFQFEHMGLETETVGKWSNRPPKLSDLKRALSKWQVELYNKAWNSLYWNNHDQARAVSHFGNDKEYREESAKMLAICLHFMQGTPYVYQGEELGMTNAYFNDISQYRDVETLNAYEDLVGRKVLGKEEMLERLAFSSRDNGRTPMQWDDSPHGGFTTGEPWISVNPNCKTINAASQVNDPDSVFSFYKRVIALRKQYDVLVSGKYELLLPESEELFAYTRKSADAKLLVACNFTAKTQCCPLPKEFEGGRCLMSNYGRKEYSSILKPYEAIVFASGHQS